MRDKYLEDPSTYDESLKDLYVLKVNTWKEDEEERFIQALGKFGNNMEAITEHVGTKTKHQV